MITLAWRSLRARWPGAVGSAIAIIIGSGLVCGALILKDSAAAVGPDGVAPWRLTNADLVIRAPIGGRDRDGAEVVLPERHRLDAGRLSEVAGVAGVRRVVAESPSPANVVSDGRKIGDGRKRSWLHAWGTAELEPFELRSGTAPGTGAEVVLDEETARSAGVGVGSEVTVNTVTGPRRQRVVGIGRWPGSQVEHAVLVTDQLAGEISGGAIAGLVTLERGADRDAVSRGIQRIMPGVEVVSGAAKARTLTLDPRLAALSGGSSQFMLVMAVSALGVAAFVIAGTLSVTVARRRNEIALLRTVGASTRRIRRLVIGEAVMIGAIAGVLGGLLGVSLGRLAIGFFTDVGMLSRAVTLVLTPVPLVIGVGSAVVTAIVAGGLPAWRAARVSPAEAMRSAEIRRGRTSRTRIVWGLVFLLVAIGFFGTGLALAGGRTFDEVALSGTLFLFSAPFLMLACVLLGRLLLTGVVAVSRRSSNRVFGLFVATRQIDADASRAVGVTVPIMLMVAFSCLFIFQEKAGFEGNSRAHVERLTPDLVVRGTEYLGVSPATTARIAGLPGVRAASGMILTRVLTSGTGPDGMIRAMVLSPEAAASVLDIPVVAGSWRAFDDRTVVVDQRTAAARGWRVGERIAFTLPDGEPATAILAAMIETGSPAFSMIIPMNTLSGHLVDSNHAGVLVSLTDERRRAEVIDGVTALRAEDPDLRALSKREFMEFMGEQSAGDDWILLFFVVLIGGYAGIAALNVMVGSTLGRRRWFALLRLAGARPHQVLGAVAWEAVILVATGVVLGTLVAAVPLVGYGYAFTRDLWLPFHGAEYAVICATALLIGLLGCLVPARVIMRTSALESMTAP